MGQDGEDRNRDEGLSVRATFDLELRQAIRYERFLLLKGLAVLLVAAVLAVLHQMYLGRWWE